MLLRKRGLAFGCLVMLGMLGSAALPTARADHGHRGGRYVAPACNHGPARYSTGYRAYSLGYAPVGGYYAPGLSLRSGVGLNYIAPGPAAYYGYGRNPYALGGYYGSPGFGAYGRQSLPRVQLRIGF